MMHYDPNSYWDERCKTVGHTGYANPIIYAYDQPLRIRAVQKIISELKISMDKKLKILDIGCGVGDFTIMFAKKGAEVYGIDISKEAINIAKERASNLNNAIFMVGKVETMNFPDETIDLILSVTVLQHIPDNAFPLAVKNIVRCLKNDGYLIIFESVKQKKKAPAFIIYRSEKDYEEAFRREGCILIRKVGYPNIGVRATQIFNRALKIIARLLKLKVSLSDLVSKGGSLGRKEALGLISVLYSLCLKLILILCYPLDYFMFPFPLKLTNYKIIVFKRRCLR